MESAREEPGSNSGLESAAGVIGYPSRRSEPVRHVFRQLCATDGVKSQFIFLRDTRVSRRKIRGLLATLPDGPDNACELIGHGDSGFVVAAATFDIESP